MKWTSVGFKRAHYHGTYRNTRSTVQQYHWFGRFYRIFMVISFEFNKEIEDQGHLKQ